MRLYQKKIVRYLFVVVVVITTTITVSTFYKTPNGITSTNNWSNQNVVTPITNHDLSEEVNKEEKYSRNITVASPFQYIFKNVFRDSSTNINDHDSTKKENSNTFSLEQWKDGSVTSKKEQCKMLVNAIYAENEDWSNEKMFDLDRNDKNLNPLLSEYSERLRIFYHCFLFNDVKLPDVFDVDSSRTALGFQHKMFPFLKFPKQDEPLLPKVTNLTSMEPVPFILKQSIKDHNENFWSNWIKMSHGRGIVTTFPDELSDYFLKQLDVLHHLNNTLPIQLVVTENELSDDCLFEIAQKARDTKQELYLVTFSNLLDGNNKKRVKGFMNKFLASVFNTFEEYIFMDGDVVPFINPEEFFDFDEYKSSGLYITRDRELDMHFGVDCADAYFQVEPTKEEVDLIDTSFKYTITTMHNRTKTAEYTSMYFKEHIKHIAESGLMMINKRTNFAGSLTSLMFMLNPRMASCSGADKELYWLGQLSAGLDYEFEPDGAALIGFPMKEYNDDEFYVKTTLRDCHIAHTHKERLVSTNGGMAKYKADHPKQDKTVIPPQRLNGFLIPDRRYSLWTYNRNHLGPAHKAFVIEVGGLEKPHGVVKWLDEDEYIYYNTISDIWNGVEDEEQSI